MGQATSSTPCLSLMEEQRFIFITVVAGPSSVGKRERPKGQIPNGCSISTSVWSLEQRPIIKKPKDRLYGSTNPTFDKAFTGLEAFIRGIAKEVET